MEKKDIKSLTQKELEEEIKQMRLPSFRAKQIYEWLHLKMVDSFDCMTNLPITVREELNRRYHLTVLKELDRRTSQDGDTSKFLFGLEDGNVIESVLMKYKHGNSVCISSQVGCRMGCRFCASTLDGLERNLNPSELLDQIYRIQFHMRERVSHVVVMGTGEPLENYEHFIRFIRLLTDEKGLHISQRNITVSTCGLVPQIYRLAEEKLQITLAISLHAPNDLIRQTLMPVAFRYKIEDILDACRIYFKKTGRRITLEYSMIKGVNDSIEMARELAERLKGLHCHVNLIPINPIDERSFSHSNEKCIQEFKNILEKKRINVTIRREMGADIDAACGQLRRRYTQTMKKGEFS